MWQSLSTITITHVRPSVWMMTEGEPLGWKQRERERDDVSVLEPQASHSRLAAWGEPGSTPAAHPAVWKASCFFPILSGALFTSRVSCGSWNECCRAGLFAGRTSFSSLIEDYHLSSHWWKLDTCFQQYSQSGSSSRVIRQCNLLYWQSWNLDLPHRKSNFSLFAPKRLLLAAPSQEIYVGSHDFSKNHSASASRPPRHISPARVPEGQTASEPSLPPWMLNISPEVSSFQDSAGENMKESVLQISWVVLTVF